jgi:hypothetical protein
MVLRLRHQNSGLPMDRVDWWVILAVAAEMKKTQESLCPWTPYDHMHAGRQRRGKKEQGASHECLAAVVDK